jgi:uncharacterized damage-inducible protein DinB
MVNTQLSFVYFGGDYLMGDTPTGMIVRLYSETHERVLKLIDDLSDEQLAWRPTPTAHSIGWNLWHLARWADFFQSLLGTRMIPELSRWIGPGRQLWEAEELAKRWGLNPFTLGYAQTGMGMDNDEAARLCLSLPGKDALLDYAHRAFDLAEKAVSAIGDDEFWKPRLSSDEGCGGSSEAIGQSVLAHLTHANRHLGQIECLRRAQGLRGSATR